MRSRMTIGRKLMLSFGGMLSLVLGLGYSSLSSIGTLSQELDTAANKTAVKTQLTGKMQVAITNMRAGQRGLILFSMLKEPAKIEMAREAFGTAATRLDKLLTDIRPLLLTSTGKKAIETIQTQKEAWMPLYHEIERSCAA